MEHVKENARRPAVLHGYWYQTVPFATGAEPDDLRACCADCPACEPGGSGRRSVPAGLAPAMAAEREAGAAPAPVPGRAAGSTAPVSQPRRCGPAFTVSPLCCYAGAAWGWTKAAFWCSSALPTPLCQPSATGADIASRLLSTSRCPRLNE